MTQNHTIAVQLDELRNECFVVMPFDALFQSEYDKIIKPAAMDAGLKCVRGDEIYSKARIVDDIWTSIRSARVVVAELTGRNPNVLYEVGLAHAIGKPVVIITRKENDVPFDLRALRYLYYDVNDPFWGQNLKATLGGMISAAISDDREAYLSGISRDPQNQFPELQKPARTSGETCIVTVSVDGPWDVTYLLSGLKHAGVIRIQQTGDELVATMTASFYFRGQTTMVEERFNGSVSNSDVLLVGTNYSFIRKGASDEYNLDRFSLKLASDGTTMQGYVKDTFDQSEVKMERIAKASSLVSKPDVSEEV